MPELAVAASVACAPVFMLADGALVIVMEIGVVETMVTVADADFVVSLTEVAVSVIVLPTAAPDGARYVAELPLAVELVMVPQLDSRQLVLHATPFTAESFRTKAIGCVVRPDPEFAAEILDGVMLTEIAAAAAGVVIVMVSLKDFVVSVTEVAVSVTVFPEGTAEGAV